MAFVCKVVLIFQSCFVESLLIANFAVEFVKLCFVNEAVIHPQIVVLLIVGACLLHVVGGAHCLHPMGRRFRLLVISQRRKKRLERQLDLHRGLHHSLAKGLHLLGEHLRLHHVDLDVVYGIVGLFGTFAVVVKLDFIVVDSAEHSFCIFLLVEVGHEFEIDVVPFPGVGDIAADETLYDHPLLVFADGGEVEYHVALFSTSGKLVKVCRNINLRSRA